MVLFNIVFCLLLLSPCSLSSSSTTKLSLTYMNRIMTDLMNNINFYLSLNNLNSNNNNNNKHSIDNDKSDSIVYQDWGNLNTNKYETPDNIMINTLKRLLFPNISTSDYHLGGYYNHDSNNVHGRQLAPIVKPPYNPATTVCLKCSGMQTCKILENLLIMEVYLPNNPEARGTCAVIDALGERVYSEIFGNGKTFRDTAQCKDIVMQYLCLFWGSDNQMYTNYCINQEDYTSVNPLLHEIAPRPPCRSFCVQLADVCANDPAFINICNEILCPPTEDQCVPDPQIQGQSLAANIGCDMPFFLDPYAPKNDGYASSSKIEWFLVLLSIIISIIWIHEN